MNHILITINHPAHVYVFRDIIKSLESRSYRVTVVATDKENSLTLLDKFNIKYISLGQHKGRLLGKLINFPIKWLKLFLLCKKIKPDIAMGIADFYIAQISKILPLRSIILTDTEHVKHDAYLTFPFSDFVLTPNCFDKEIGKNHIMYNSYHELSYLHSNFRPDHSVLDDLNLSQKENYVVLRLVAWEAFHDLGMDGANEKLILSIINELRGTHKIFISSEKEIPPNLEKYKLLVPVEKMHSVLYFSSLYIGEGATMASEAAVLGTPSIYLSKLSVGYLKDLSKNYDIVSIPESENDIFKAIEIKRSSHIDQKASVRRKILSSKLNLSNYITNFVEEILTEKDRRLNR